MAFVLARPIWSTPAASRLGKWLKIASGLLLFSAYTAITTSCGLPAQSANLSAAGASSKLSSFEFANTAGAATSGFPSVCLQQQLETHITLLFP